ncbi:nucleoside-diphosphate-sugar epimerase [Rhizobium sp. ERR 922]|uniref:NAD-dependent epimerase/dehydratase family protein n=1 Tax=unclassified Rhizobium TaxID=2613769 RepID=UPI000DE08E64|nr:MULTISPECIES: NAD(P)-dependent oxidoreductase [unclassified Rhizobium]TWB44060.1 nucleoside-diphosphate-sugar epimerase [Rhizobium sp. ERR 922]TWB87837.1 nucleoside-diphosphate-sugar epimerase [Rhizobium sp. ERR 942]
MPKTIFLAGATGAIGRRLVPQLLDAGYDVFGTTRSSDKARDLDAAGVHAVVVDVFDRDALKRAVIEANPDVIIHQLTDLPPAVDPSRASEFAARNARIRREGTANLMRAAMAAGAKRIIAQSIAWAYAAGNEPHDESAPLDLAAPEPRSVSVSGVAALEAAVLGEPERVTGIVLRYGRLYGPATGADLPDATLAVHVDAAARAAMLAVKAGTQGIYNIAEASPMVSSAKAIRELGWTPEFRI